jgi:hypothetical protein
LSDVNESAPYLEPEVEDRPGERKPWLKTLGILVLLAFVVFIAALVIFDNDSGGGACNESGRTDPAFAAALSSPAQMGKRTYELIVTRAGQPVPGATVCLSAVMDDDMSVAEEAREVGPGRYQVEVDFDMEGAWEGSVLVTPEGEEPVAVPFYVEVPKEGAMNEGGMNEGGMNDGGAGGGADGGMNEGGMNDGGMSGTS